MIVPISRRGFLVGAAAIGSGFAGRPYIESLRGLIGRSIAISSPPAAGWTVSAHAVLDVDAQSPWINRAVYDAAVLREDDSSLCMWYSTRRQARQHRCRAGPPGRETVGKRTHANQFLNRAETPLN